LSDGFNDGDAMRQHRDVITVNHTGVCRAVVVSVWWRY